MKGVSSWDNIIMDCKLRMVSRTMDMENEMEGNTSPDSPLALLNILN